ncbi:MAG: PP2C family protein-serine/threonine phosphatase [Candidatus Limnocylindrales bacterium]
MASDPTSAADAALVVVHGAMSTTGPVRERNEDHLGWGIVGTAGSGVVVGSRADVAPMPLISAVDGPLDAWGPVGGSASIGGGARGAPAPPGAPAPRGAAAPPGTGVVFCVADGLGGYGGGDVASRIAIGELIERFEGERTISDEVASRGAAMLRAGFAAAHQRVFDAALAGEGTRRMQTTLSALLLLPGEAHIGHVGDSRIYRRRGDMLDLLTTDHTQVMEMLRMRLIRPDQAADHPARHALTRSLGAELTVRTDVRLEPLADGDTFLLCSDGLWSKVDSNEIRDALGGDVRTACERLVLLAVERGGEDNATAVTVRVERAGRASERPRGWRRFLPS